MKITAWRTAALLAFAAVLTVMLPAGADAAGRTLKPDGRHTSQAPKPERGPKAVEPSRAVQVPLGLQDPEQLRREKERAAREARPGGGDPFGALPGALDGDGGGGPNVAIFSGLNQAGLAGSTNSPPDTTGAVGPSHYLEMVNGTGIAVYSKTDLSQVGSTVSLRNFIQRPTGTESVFDPQIMWDPQSSRWYYLLDRIEGTSPSRIAHLAYGWSKTADPTDLANGWCHQNINTGAEFDDYPKLGDNDSHLVFGTNVFGTNVGGFSTARVWTVPKPAAGVTTCPASVPGIQSFGTPALPLKTADNFNAFTPVPANTMDSSANGYVVAENRSGGNNEVMAWHVSATGALVQDGNVAVNPYSVPPPVPQPNVGCAGTCDTLDSLDRRLTQAVSTKDPDAGGAQAVWTQHSIADPAGTGRSVVRWYELLPGNCAGGTCPASARRQQGEVKDPTHHAFNAAIAPTTTGNAAVINYNVASGSLTAEIRARSRLTSTGLGAMGAEITLGTSAGSLDDFTCGTRDTRPSCRWGDYAGATPDPANSNVVWGSNQSIGPVIPGTAHWRTRNFALQAVASPSLAHDATATSDPGPGGDGDGVVEPGETVNLNETLRNNGDGAATGISGTLSASTTGVTVPQPSSPYPDIAPAASGTNSSPFRVALAGTVPCGQTLNLSLAVTSAQGSFTVPVTVPTGASGTSTPRSSTDVPKAIPDNSAAGVTSTLAVADAGPIKDVNATITGITHPFVGDLKLELIGPDGTIVVLTNRPGGPANSGDNFTNTVFDDEAPGTIAAGTPPYTGSFRPEQPLSAFDGKSQQGTWTLKVSDLGPADVGTLTGWGTTTTQAVCATSSNVPPSASFTATPNPAQVGQSVSFNGSASADPDGTIAKYEWDLDGNGSFETDTGTTPTTSRAYTAPATLDVKLRVTDNNGATGETTRSLPIAPATVTPPILPPVLPPVTPPVTPPAGKHRTSLTLSARPSRDRRPPFGFTFSGRVRIPAGVSAAAVCGGRVRLVLKKGRRTVATGTATVSRGCTYRRRITIRSTRRTGRRRARLRVSARFGGNASLSVSSRSTTVRIF